MKFIAEYKGFEIWDSGYTTSATRYCFGCAYKTCAPVYTYNAENEERGSFVRSATSIRAVKEAINERLFWESEEGQRVLSEPVEGDGYFDDLAKGYEDMVREAENRCMRSHTRSAGSGPTEPTARSGTGL